MRVRAVLLPVLRDFVHPGTSPWACRVPFVIPLMLAKADPSIMESIESPHVEAAAVTSKDFAESLRDLATKIEAMGAADFETWIQRKGPIR